MARAVPLQSRRPIVVVDDDVDLHETLGELLADEGYDPVRRANQYRNPGHQTQTAG